MKIQNLAVIFVIIILPISLILTSYVQNQVKTLELQMSYDTKLTNATYDAVKAFQLNTVNSSTSDLANSKIRDIQASINSFFNSVSTQFNLAGYNKDILKAYVPALVYTMYDGYYIYSPFTNTLDQEDSKGTTYKNGDKLYNLKPYIHYSCRYKNGSTDVVITYSLDNYIQVEGIVNGKPESRSGYLLDNVRDSGGNVSYRQIPITTENLSEKLIVSDDLNTQTYTYTKINGVKYYKDNSTGKWFSILNGTRYDSESANFKTTNDAGQRYYKEAKEFTDWVSNNLGSLKSSDAVNENGTGKITDTDLFNSDYKIFTGGSSGTSIEDPNSNFNQQRLAVIRYSIEKNLSIAIANYNNYTTVTTDFEMPKLKEDEWEKILNNVSVISFLQGLSIGGKIYNGYSIVTNTKTEELVNTDSIYLITGDGYYHRATDKDLVGKSVQQGFLNTDFERKSMIKSDSSSAYFFPHSELGCYSSIVNQSNVDDLSNSNDNIYKYMAEKGGDLAQKYFTALGRERYSMYKTNNNTEELTKEFSN